MGNKSSKSSTPCRNSDETEVTLKDSKQVNLSLDEELEVDDEDDIFKDLEEETISNSYSEKNDRNLIITRRRRPSVNRMNRSSDYGALHKFVENRLDSQESDEIGVIGLRNLGALLSIIGVPLF